MTGSDNIYKPGSHLFVFFWAWEDTKWLKEFNLTGASSKAREIKSLWETLGEYHPHVQNYIIRINILEKSNHHLIAQDFPFTTKYSIVQNMKSCQNLQAVQ